MNHFLSLLGSGPVGPQLGAVLGHHLPVPRSDFVLPEFLVSLAPWSFLCVLHYLKTPFTSHTIPR